MNNEPVAWMRPDTLECGHGGNLTDEEILQVMINVYSDTVPPIRGVEFARAILRKAQEK